MYSISSSALSTLLETRPAICMSSSRLSPDAGLGNITALNHHLYYASRGLEKAVELYPGHADYKGSWDWEHPEGYVKIKTLDVRRDDISDYMEVVEG